MREEWKAFDLVSADGIKIEVKSAAYVQSWFQRGPSKIVFSTPETCGWSSETNLTENEKKRQSDVYVFALLKHEEKATIDPMDLNQWEFYVLSRKLLDERIGRQKSVSLKVVRSLCICPIHFSDLAPAIEAVGSFR